MKFAENSIKVVPPLLKSEFKKNVNPFLSNVNFPMSTRNYFLVSFWLLNLKLT